MAKIVPCMRQNASTRCDGDLVCAVSARGDRFDVPSTGETREQRGKSGFCESATQWNCVPLPQRAFPFFELSSSVLQSSFR